MHLEQLTYFIEIAKTKSMSTASTNLHITQQNISKAIKQLEDELGTTLFARTPKGVFLTETGKAMYADALEILTKSSAMMQKYSQAAPSSAKGELSILSAFGLSNLQVTISQLFAKNYPQYTISIQETDPALVNNALADNTTHAIVIAETDTLSEFQTAALQQKYHAFLVKKDALRLQAAKFSPIAEQKSISLNSLSYLPLLGYHSSDCAPYFFQTLKKQGIIPHCSYSLNNLITAFTFLRAGTAYGLTTKFADTFVPQVFTDDLILIPLRTRLYINYVIFLEKTQPSWQTSTAYFYDIFKETYEQLY